LGDIKERFNLFKSQVGSTPATASESDTGGGMKSHPTNISSSRKVLEDEKDKRIKALEEEVARLKERER
jgi:uncharacterized protein YceH (UPF0502 family)